MKHRMIYGMGIVVALTVGAWAEGLPMEESEAQIIKSRMIPYPKQVEIFDGPVIKIDTQLQVTITLQSEIAGLQDRTGERFRSYFGVIPVITFKSNPKLSILKDGYRLKVDTSGMKIEAADVGGLLNALKTLRQLAETERGVERHSYYFLPLMTVEDAPTMAFRGIHLCWFPETEVTSIEKCIRMAAYYKFNYLVLEPWAVYDFKSFPQFAWAEKKIDTETIHRLVHLAREQGLTLIPQLNLFGHASGSRHISGKHPVLDFHPDMQSLYEPDGWTWCLSNPATRKVLTGMVLELFEAFEQPPYFHIGCDEAYSMATCRTCRKADYASLLKDHLLHFRELFSERRAKVMMWHDMLLVAGDSRWTGYVATGSAKIGTEALLDVLPRDMVICDWQYYTPPPPDKPQWPTMQYFQQKGFSVLACPWKDTEGTESQARLVRERGLAGMLCTTWNSMHGTDMYRMLYAGAHATWGYKGTGWNSRSTFNQHLRQIGWDIPIKYYKDTGVAPWQVPPENALLP